MVHTSRRSLRSSQSMGLLTMRNLYQSVNILHSTYVSKSCTLFVLKNDFLSTLFLYKPLRTVWARVFSFLTMCMYQMRLDINWPAKHFTTNRTGSRFLMDTPEEERKFKTTREFSYFLCSLKAMGVGKTLPQSSQVDSFDLSWLFIWLLKLVISL